MLSTPNIHVIKMRESNFDLRGKKYLIVIFFLLSIVYKPTILFARLAVAGKVTATATVLPRSKSPTTTTNKFRWSQSVDSVTGVASSLETSSFTSMFSKYEGDDGELLPMVTRLRRLCIHRRVAEIILTSYPQFVARKSVTFGLLSTKRRASTNQEGLKNGRRDNLEGDYCVDLYNPLLGVSFLTFGPVRHHHHIQKNMKVKFGAIFSMILPFVGVTQLVNERSNFITEIPIIGGCLVNRKCRKITTSEAEQRPHYGSLRFEIQQDKSLQYDRGNIHHLQTTMELKTQIIGYTPTIVGIAPVNPIRKLVYYSSQRLAHAYVMFRFHTHILEICREKTYDNEVNDKQLFK